MAYREAGRLGFQAGEISGEDTGLVKLTRAHQTREILGLDDGEAGESVGDRTSSRRRL